MTRSAKESKEKLGKNVAQKSGLNRDAASGWVMIKWALGFGQELTKAGHAAKPLLSETEWW